MKYKRRVIMLILTIFILLTLASVSASEINDNLSLTVKDTDNFEISDDNQVIGLTNDFVDVDDSANFNGSLDELQENDIGVNDEYQYGNTDVDILSYNGENNPIVAKVVQVSGSTFNDIQNAINRASAGDIISLNGGTTYSGSGTQITVNKQITIEGNGASLHQNSKTRILAISANNVKLNNIKFYNGGETLQGGGVCFSDGSVNCIVSNCYFNNNRATQGSAIYGAGKNNRVVNCVFDSNYGEYGAVQFCGENEIITDCVFRSNTATTGGGAVFLSGVNETVTNCLFDGNHARRYGGALQFNYRSINCTVTNSTFKSNYAMDSGAIYASGEGNTISYCDFSDNKACDTESTSESYKGGAIGWNVKNGKIIYCNFTNNKATHSSLSYGGAIFFYNNGYVSNCKFEGNGVSVSNEGGTAVGGAICFDNDYVTDCDISNCTFSNTTSLAVFFKGDVSNCIISDCTFSNMTSSAIYFYGDVSNCIISDSIFSECDDSAIVIGGNICNSSFSNQFSENSAKSRAGAIKFIGEVSNCNISGEFERNYATDCGGALYFNKNVYNCNISGVFSENSAFTMGGAVFFYKNVFNCDISGEFERNYATDYGGAVLFYGSLYDTNISGEFINNRADVGGAILFYSSSSGCILSATFMDNNAIGNTSWGGALFFNDATYGSVICGSFINNYAERAGAIYSLAIFDSIISGEFIGNNANYGGAIYTQGLSSTISGEFVDNKASRYGGAIYFMGSVNDTNISGEFKDNYAGTYGGAIYLQDNISNILISGKFINNTAESSHGDAIMCSNDVYDLTISALFMDNGGQDSEAIFLNKNCFNSKIINSILLDKVYSKGIISFINDWFGHTSANYNIKPHSMCDSWLFLDGNYSLDGDLTVVFNLNNLYNSSSDCITHPDVSGLPDFTFDLTAVNAVLDKDSAAPGENVIFNPLSLNDVTIKGTLGDFSYSVNVPAIFKFKTVLTAEDVFAMYNEDSRLIAELKDGRGNPISGVKVKFTIGSLTKTMNTYSSGKAFISTKSLAPGDYVATVSYAGDDSYAPATTTANIVIKDKLTFTDLQKKIDDADEGSTIVLKYNYTYDPGFSTDGITISKAITINGNGYTIDALGQSRIFNINSSTVTLNNITFKNGYSDGDGGAIVFSTSVSGCNVSGEFINNTASCGGAIVFSTSVSGCNVSGEFINNTAEIYGGAIVFSTSISDSSVSGEFIGNTASYGGAIYFSEHVFDSSVSGEFIGNTAYSGGAIYFYGVSASSVSGEFIGNTANSGGAIYIGGYVFDSSVSGEFIGNTAYSGGVIYFYGVSASSVSGEFIGNTADYGGAIYISGQVSDSSISGEFINNRAYYDGGAIRFGNSVSGSSISGCNVSGEFINNRAYYDGGAIYIPGSVSDSSIINSVVLDSIYNPRNLASVNTWFGNNASNYENKLTDVNCESWLFLDASYVPVSVADGKFSVTFTLDNLYDSSSNLITHPDISDLPDVVFELSAVNGYLDKYSARPGESVIFKATGDDDGIVRATYGGVSYSIKVRGINVVASDVDKYYGGSESFVVTVTDRLNRAVPVVYVKITVDGETFVGLTDDKGQYSIPLYLNPGNYAVTTNCESIEVKSTVNVYSTVESSDINAFYKNVTFESTYLDGSGNPLSNMTVIFIVGESTYIATTDVNGIASIDIELDAGNYIITTFNPITNETKNNNLVISKADSSMSISAETFINGVTLTVDIIPDDVSGVVVFTINGINYTALAINSKVTLIVNDLSAGTYTAQATYLGDSNHNPSTSSITFKVRDSKVDTILTVEDVTVYYHDASGRLTVELKEADGTPISDAEVNIVIDGMSQSVRTSSSGKAYISTEYLDVGDHVGIASFAGDDYHYAVATMGNVAVRMGTVLSAEDLVVVSSDASGKWVVALKDSEGNPIGGAKVKITVGGLTKTMNTYSNGKAYIGTKTLAPGDYVATVSYDGDDYYAPASATANVAVRMATVLTAEDAVVVYQEASGKWVVALKDDSGNPISGVKVKLTVGDLTKSMRTLSSGKAYIGTKSLDVGDYVATVTFDGDDYYAPASATANVVVKKIDTVLTAEDAVVVYQEASGMWVVALKDASGNPISGVKVKLTVGDLTKSMRTLSSGKAYIGTKSLDIGDYVATVTFDGDDYYAPASATAKVTVKNNKLSTVLTAEDAVVVYQEASGKWVVALKDDSGNPISGVKVKLTVGDLTKTMKTLSSGKAYIGTKTLAPGEYAASVTFDGDDTYAPSNATAKVLVKMGTVLTAEDVVATCGDSSRLIVQLKDTAGNPISGVKVKFKIGDLTKTMNTYSNGKAFISTKSLAPGNYTAVISCAGNEDYAASSATANVIIKQA